MSRFQSASVGARAALLAATVIALMGCELQPLADADPPDGSVDAGIDAPVPPDAGLAPSVAGDADVAEDADSSLPNESFAAFRLKDGKTARGEWVSTYNSNYWWHDAGPEFTFGVFDIQASAGYPDDHAFRFLSSLEVESIEYEPWPDGRLTYQQAMREWQTTIDQVPLAGTVHVLTGNDSYHLEEDGYGDFGFDLAYTDSGGARFVGDGTNNEDYLVWGAEVTLPTSGYVIDVVRDQADNTVGEYEDGAPANMIGIHLFGSYYLYLLHLQQDSIPDEVQVDTWLFRGARLGKVGNSGVSLEPHLHVVLLWWDADATPPRSWSVPVEFRDVEAAETPDGPFMSHDFLAPKARTWIRSLGE